MYELERRSVVKAQKLRRVQILNGLTKISLGKTLASAMSVVVNVGEEGGLLIIPQLFLIGAPAGVATRRR